MSGEINKRVAVEVLGMTTQTVKPSWYSTEVTLFFEPGFPLVQYSWDERSCNAMMHRNGVDGKDGTAPPLPSYSDDMEYIGPVIVAMGEQGFTLTLRRRDERRWDASFDGVLVSGTTAEEAICLAALGAKERSQIGEQGPSDG